MYKGKAYFLIYLSMVLSVLLSAGALDRHTVPQQQFEYTVPPKTDVSENIYIDFMNKVRGYPPAKKEEMKTYYHKKMKEAMRERNFNAAKHYERLIAILNSN